MANSVGEGPPNWLSEIIGEQRRNIERWLPRVERRAEANAIVAAIKRHPEGKSLATHPELDTVVWEAVGHANAVDHEAKRNPKTKNVSGNVQASWYIFRDLGVPIPGMAAGT